MASRKTALEAIEAAIAKNPKGKPLIGAELVPDGVPMAPPIGYRKSPSIIDMVRNQIRSEMSRHAQMRGYESFEEADDFNTGEDDELRSPYEVDEASEVPISVLRDRERRAMEEASQDPLSTQTPVPPPPSPQSNPPVQGEGGRGASQKEPPDPPAGGKKPTKSD